MFLHHGVDEGTNATANPHAHVIAVFQVLWGLLDKADTLRCAGHDDRAREEGSTLRKERNGLADVEDLVAERRG